MKRRTFSLLEVMLVVAIIGTSVELSKIVYQSRALLWESVTTFR